MIIVGGTMGLGKTTISTMLSEHFKSQVFYESVDDNKVLPLFYTLTEEELLAQRIPFLLQLHFLDTRYRTIKKAAKGINNVMDRSLKEELYFCTNVIYCYLSCCISSMLFAQKPLKYGVISCFVISRV